VTVSSHDDRIHGKAYDARLARRLLPYMRPHAALALASLALTAVTSVLVTLPPVFLGLAVDRGIMRRDADALTALALGYLACEGVRFVGLYAQGIAIALLGQRVMQDLRNALAAKLLSQSQAFFHREPAGRLMTRVVNDVASVGELFSAGAVAVVGDLFAIAASGALLLAIDVPLALTVFAAVPLLALTVNGINAKIRESFRELRRLLARNASYIAENLHGIRVVQAFGREPAHALRFREKNDEHLGVQLGSTRWHAIYVSSITVITFGAIAALIGVGGSAALSGRIQIGALVAAIGCAQTLFQPIRDIAEKLAIFQAAMASAERIFGLMDEDVSVRAPERPLPLPSPIRGEVVLEDVSFSYAPRRVAERAQDEPAQAAPGSEEAESEVGDGAASLEEARPASVPALHRVSLRIAPGERVAVVGRTGAGKSTLTSLFGRFYDATEGRVLVDGIDVRLVDPTALRREIGVVLQDVFIFAGTVLENIRLGDLRVTIEAAKQAARLVGAEEWILRLPLGYDEPMRERGATLSTGQKQLLSFARALAFDPRILILDEATASVDPETEAQIRRAIQAVMRGRTSILIAHRLATIEGVDRVLVFHKGELREEGTIPALLERDGIFRRLYRLQGEATAAPG